MKKSSRIFMSNWRAKTAACVNQVLLNAAFTIGCKEVFAVGVGFEIIRKRPKPPEKVKMLIAHAAFAHVDYVFALQIRKHDVWKAIIAVKNGVILKKGPCAFDGF